MEEKITWSHSALKDYEGCARRYHEVKVLNRFPFQDTEQTRYGKDLHLAAELYVKEGTPIPEQFSFMQEHLDKLKDIPGEKLCEERLGLTYDLKPCTFFAKIVMGKPYWNHT